MYMYLLSFNVHYTLVFSMNIIEFTAGFTAGTIREAGPCAGCLSPAAVWNLWSPSSLSSSALVSSAARQMSVIYNELM